MHTVHGTTGATGSVHGGHEKVSGFVALVSGSIPGIVD
jgi:hypothetical protein